MAVQRGRPYVVAAAGGGCQCWGLQRLSTVGLVGLHVRIVWLDIRFLLACGSTADRAAQALTEGAQTGLGCARHTVYYPS